MIILMVVDLPAPFGPRRPKISPSLVAKETSVHGVHAAEALADGAKLDHDFPFSGRVYQRMRREGLPARPAALSPRVSFQLLQESRCRVGAQGAGYLTFTFTIWSPIPLPRSCGHPLPLEAEDGPALRPRRVSSLQRPSSVGT